VIIIIRTGFVGMEMELEAMGSLHLLASLSQTSQFAVYGVPNILWWSSVMNIFQKFSLESLLNIGTCDDLA